MRLIAPLIAAALAVAAGPAAYAEYNDMPSSVAPGKVQEPQGLYEGAMHGYTPSTVKGGQVIDTAGLEKLIDKEKPLLLDVAEKDRKPPSMSPGTPWLPLHRSLPGAVFLQGGGKGWKDKAFDAAFKARVEALTGGQKDKPIVTFCHPDCWGSYNAARRLADLGYTKVHWYRDGVEGWQADHDTRVVKPDSAWVASLPQEATQ